MPLSVGGSDAEITTFGIGVDAFGRWRGSRILVARVGSRDCGVDLASALAVMTASMAKTTSSGEYQGFRYDASDAEFMHPVCLIWERIGL
jgi:hypothetical protein